MNYGPWRRNSHKHLFVHLCTTMTQIITNNYPICTQGLKYNFQGGELFICPGPQFVPPFIS